MTHLIDAYELFSTVLDGMMRERGLDKDEPDAMRRVVHQCAEQIPLIWAEYEAWVARRVMDEEEKKVMTRALLRGQLERRLW